MVEIWLPYGMTEVSVKVPEENFKGAIEIKDDDPLENLPFHIERSLQSPIGSKPLRSMVETGEKAVLVIEDTVRPAIVNDLIPPVIVELVGAGLRPEDITVLFGTNMQGSTRVQQISQVGGAEFASRLKILSHNYKSNDLLHVGDTGRGTGVFLNTAFVKADVKILVGNVGLHPYAGYTGGRTGVLPGVSGEQTILRNHALLVHVNARPGVLNGNPVSEDMTEAAELAEVDFVVNAVLNRRGQIVRVFSGDLQKAFHSASTTVEGLCKVPCESKVDIAVVSAGGSPEDATLCQSIESVCYALDVVEDGGAIVLVAECSEGHGNQVFGQWMGKFDKPRQFEQEIAKRFAIGGQYAYLLVKALEKVRVYLVSAIPDYYVSNVFRMRPGRTVTGALQTSLRTIGKDSKVIVIPHGASTLPVPLEHTA
jgi:nickel-dependent lactate racemase